MKQPQRVWKSYTALLSLALGLTLPACGGSDPKPPAAESGKGGSPDTGTPRGGGGAPASPAGGKSGTAAVGGGGTTSAEGGRGGSGPAAGSGGSAPIMRATKFDAGSDPNRNKVSAADVCKRLAEINCAGEAFCCDSPGRSVEACKTEIVRACSQELMLDQVAANPITGFDAAAAERGYTELESKASKCDPSVAAWGNSPEGLRGLLKGTVAPDASCMPTQTLPDPAMIAASLLSCKDDRACLYDNPLGPWTCAQRSAASGPCLTDNNCKDGLHCVLPPLTVVGSCMDRKPSGDSCTAPAECKSFFCKQGKCVDASQQAAYCLEN